MEMLHHTFGFRCPSCGSKGLDSFLQGYPIHGIRTVYDRRCMGCGGFLGGL